MTDTASPDAPGARRTIEGAAWNVFATFIWGAWMVVTGIGVQAGLDAYDITAIRLGIAGLLLLPVLVRHGFAYDRLGPIGLVTLVAGAGAPFVFVLVMGMKFAPVRHASVFINGVIPVGVAVMAFFLFAERLSWPRIAGLALIVVGVSGFVVEGLSDHNMWIGHGFFLLGAILWSAFTVTARYAGLTPFHATAIVSVVSFILYVPAYFAVFGTRLMSTDPWVLALQVFYQGGMTGIVAIYAVVRAIAAIGPSRSAAFSPLAPIIAMLLAIPVLDDWPTAIDLVGIVVVSAGVVLATGLIGRAKA